MITYDHFTYRLFGIPFFTLAVGIAFLVAAGALYFGVSHWRQRRGKVAVLAGGSILLLFALAVICVIVTVTSGSMG